MCGEAGSSLVTVIVAALSPKLVGRNRTWTSTVSPAADHEREVEHVGWLELG